MDTNTLDHEVKQFAEKFPQLKKRHDYRKLLDEMGKDIDAVTVSTPNHNHGSAALRAMKPGEALLLPGAAGSDGLLTSN